MLEYSVLIIDDDPWMQRILSKTLQSYGFRKVILASNGFEGIGYAVDEAPNLIILDILMPELSGHITLKIMKQIKLIRNIPVLMVSALSDTENLGLAVKLGTAGFISKPFTRSTVYEKLVAIYGKYNLDKIAKGEEIETTIIDETEDNGDGDGFRKDNMFLESLVGDNALESSDLPSMGGGDDQLKKEYREEDKKNIESIKKLLLKTKK